MEVLAGRNRVANSLLCSTAGCTKKITKNDTFLAAKSLKLESKYRVKHNLLSIYFMALNHALEIGISVEEGQFSWLRPSLFMDT